VAGAAAVIDHDGRILLMRRADNRLWAMPAGQMEVGETPAEAVVRDIYDETGIRSAPTALVGIYDSRIWANPKESSIYMCVFTFLCDPLDQQSHHSLDASEALEIGWFTQNNLPTDL
jgi:ADP-ribose pyrophosphatase YjhB (NUDIX family)